MLDLAFEPTTEQSWIPSSVWRCLHLLEQEELKQQETDIVDDVPVMLATVLGLDLLLREPCIDLRKASDLVLSDVGATLQVLRLIGREFDFAMGGPSRMGDCLASLDVHAWFGAMSARAFASDSEHEATTALWKHCRLVAQYAQLVAESLDGVCPEDAYLVGLLHEAGAIPALLGWPIGNSNTSDPDAQLAMEGSLPLFVLAAMRSVNDLCRKSTWRLILTAAHELAGARTDYDVSMLDGIDSVGIDSRWKRFLPSEAEGLPVTPAAPGFGFYEEPDFCCLPTQQLRTAARPPVLIRTVVTASVGAAEQEAPAGSQNWKPDTSPFLISNHRIRA